MGILDFLNIGMKLVDKLIPDPAQKAEMQLKLLELQQNGDLAALNAETQLLVEQSKTNQIEAQSDNLFKSGWRPLVGWTSAVIVAIQFGLRPIVIWVAAWNGHPIDIPPLDTGEIIGLLTGMLGIGTLRSVDKKNGAA